MTLLKKTKRDVVSEFRCEEILGAARKVFARKGFDGASVDDIAETAGLAKGTVYVYFHSKRELYLAVLKRGIATLMEETKRSVGAAATTGDKVRAFIATRMRYAEKNQDFIAIHHTEFGRIHPDCLSKELKNLYLEQTQAIAVVLEEAVRQGEIHLLSPDAAAYLIYEMTRALIGRRLLGWSRASVEEDIHLLFELIWNGLAGSGEPACPEEAACIVPGQC